MHVPKNKHNKLQARSVQCIFVGYCSGSKAFRLYDPVAKKIFFSRDVVFDECITPSPSKQAAAVPKVALVPADDPEPAGADSCSEEEEDAADAGEAPAAAATPPRRSTRIHRPPTQWWKTGNAAFAFLGSSEPSTFQEAVIAPDGELWKAALDAEYQSQMENKSWVLSKLPAGRKAIGCKWVFKKKLKADGSLERYKARFVASKA